MDYEVVLHRSVSKYLAKLAKDTPAEAERCKDALTGLEENPFKARPGVDISSWEGPEFDYRLRVGRHRFGYRVDKNENRVYVDEARFK